MNISLTPEMESFIQQQVNGGLYPTASEVVLTALRHFKEEQRQPRLPELPSTREELGRQLQESIDRLDRGEGVSSGESLRRMQAMIANSGTHA